MRTLVLTTPYDLIIAHGCLHLLEREHWRLLLDQIRRCTSRGGYNVIAVFTDTIEPPEDLVEHTVGLFREGELFEPYDGWDVILRRSYVLEDHHPGGNRHRHPINKIVARKP